MQEGLETKHLLTSFKLSLPSGSEMRMMRWVSRTPGHFLIHVQGAIQTIKEMELDTKLQEANRSVKSANVEVKLSKMTSNDELKKGERDYTLQQAVGAGKTTRDKSKKLKKTEGDKSPQAAVIAAKAGLDEA